MVVVVGSALEEIRKDEEGGSSWMRENGERGRLKACARRFRSVRQEKVASRRRVRICEKGGESMRSAVSSRRRRRGGAVVCWMGEGEEGGEGIVDGGFAGVRGGVDTPDSRRTASSWSG